MDLMDAREAAKYVRVLSYWTLLDLARRGEIPHIRVGKRIFFSIAALNKWVQNLETGGANPEESLQRGKLRRVQI